MTENNNDPKELTVAVNLTFKVDRAAWAEAYGEEESAAEIREAIKSIMGSEGVAGAIFASDSGVRIVASK